MSQNIQIGYSPDFIGDNIRIPLPKFSRSLAQSVLRKPTILRKGLYSDHIHFTLVMNKHTRQLIYSAYNIDQSKFRAKVAGKGKRSWKKDKDIGNENQLGNDYYKDRKSASGEKIPNPYDKGHMVMRFNNMWGDTNKESDKAGKATFIYANSSLQHENLNRDEWKELEINIVRSFQADVNDRLSIFTGPIYGDLDRHINLSDQDSARVPSGFFKIICYRTKHPEVENQLGVLAFVIFQDAEVLRDKKGSATVKTNRRYQVTISEIQDLTGINFGKTLYDCNPLFYHDIAKRNTDNNVTTIPERIAVGPGRPVVVDSSQRRPDEQHLASRKIIINSAMINPKTNERRGEWVSLHNRGNRKTNITNWKLVDGKGREALLDGNINSGESIRLKGTKKGKVLLSNSGGSLMLYDNHNCLVDYANWSKHQIDILEEGIALVFENTI
jgi:endonuclease G, mitochondrial